MPTTVHIPPELLRKLDKRARDQGTSRNKVIVRAIERELESSTGWPPGFFERVKARDPEDVAAVDEMMDHIRKNRRSKGPPKL